MCCTWLSLCVVTHGLATKREDVQMSRKRLNSCMVRGSDRAKTLYSTLGKTEEPNLK
jgi:hypothetical protein